MLKTGILPNSWGIKKNQKWTGIMKTIQLTVLIAGLSLMALKAEAQTTWNFHYSYFDVLATNVLDYVVQQQNIEIVNEGDNISYWCPVNNGTEAILTQEFTFPQPTTQVFLLASLSSFNFGSGEYGSGSLWGAIDGTNWVQLENAPTPSQSGYGYTYATNLPNSLIGSNQIWIQARLETTGWNIMAQFSRQNNVTNAFELDANYGPAQVVFVKAFTVDFTNLLIGSNYQAQASTNLVTWTNWGAAFTATNSSYTNTNYQRITDWNQLFFRMVQQ
jgi:hypothetical protein